MSEQSQPKKSKDPKKQAQGRRARRKGDKFERKVLEVLRCYFPARFINEATSPRRSGRGFGNCEFINMEWFPLYLETKNRKVLKLEDWLPQVRHDAELAGKPWCIVWHPPGTPEKKMLAFLELQYYLNLTGCRWIPCDNIIAVDFEEMLALITNHVL